MSDYLSTVKPRSEIIAPSETVTLKAMFRGTDGNPSDLDSFPTVTIVQPSGNVVLGPTSAGVSKLGVGVYGFDYMVGLNPSVGVWSDVWMGSLSGNFVGGTFNFVIHTFGQIPAVNSDGYEHLGDDPGFQYSRCAIHNINLLLKTLRARLTSRGMTVSKDEHGNKTFITCDIFQLDDLIAFLAQSLSLYNETPHFTFFTFDDTWFVQVFHDVIVQGAVLMALSSKALIERGREGQITDNGLSWNPSSVSEMLSTQWGTELQNHWDKIKMIKGNMKPAALGLGTTNPLGGNRTVYRNLQNMRARRLI